MTGFPQCIYPENAYASTTSAAAASPTFYSADPMAYPAFHFPAQPEVTGKADYQHNNRKFHIVIVNF